MATYSRSKKLLKKQPRKWIHKHGEYRAPTRLQLRWFPPRKSVGWEIEVYGPWMSSWLLCLTVETSPTNTSQNPHQWP